MKSNETMTTSCNYTPKTEHEVYQLKCEIKWLINECIKVKEQIKKRPSKIRHLNDLERQIKDREECINRYLTA